MNEKIRELATQVDPELAKDTIYCTSKDLEKFAELIVRECAQVAGSQTLEKYPGMKSEYDGIVYVEEAIKKHFGVEE